MEQQTETQHDPIPRRLADGLAVALAIVTLIAGTWVATDVFDRVPHLEDEVSFLFQAQSIAAGYLTPPVPEHSDFFQMPFIIREDDRWFGKYPPGFPLVFSLTVLAGYDWMINPIAAAVAVLLVYLAGRRLYGSPLIGLIAAGLLAVSPLFLLHSGTMMSHVTSLVWTMAFVLLFDRARRTHSWSYGLFAGLAIGMLFLSRPLTAVGIGLPFAIWVIVDMIRARWHLLHTYMPMAGGFGVFLLLFLAYNWYTTGSPTTSAYELWWPYDKIGFGEGHGFREGGHTIERGWANLKNDTGALADFLYGWPGRLSVLPVLFGAALMFESLGRRIANWGRHRRASNPELQEPNHRTPATYWDLVFLGMAISLIAAQMLYWTNMQIYGPRYYFEIIGALTLVSARGITGTAAYIDLGLRFLSARIQGAYTLLMAGALTILLILTAIAYEDFHQDLFEQHRGWYDIDRQELEMVREENPENALIFIEGEFWTDYSPFLTRNTPLIEGDVIYAIDLGERNQELIEAYPDRNHYIFTEENELVMLDVATRS